MNKPHKHAALIKAWADGAEIQVRDLTNYKCKSDCRWTDFSEFDDEVWYNEWEYRIKPETIKYRISLHKNGNREAYTYSWSDPSYVKDIELTSETFVRWLTDWIEVEV